MNRILAVCRNEASVVDRVRQLLAADTNSHGSVPGVGHSVLWAQVEASADEGRLVRELEQVPGVEWSQSFEGDYALVARRARMEVTLVPFGRSVFGESMIVIGGPCSAESPAQVDSIALSVARAGAHGLRGGAFKPRTSPYSFQGLGKTGLVLLRRAADLAGLPLVTEVMAPDEVDLVSEYADLLQVGSRNMQNFRLLEAVGRSHRPVLLKRGFMSRVHEFLAAAEYIYCRGNQQIVLCERGIRGFDPTFRNTLDLSAVVWLKERSHLPVIVDPSHAGGANGLVTPLALAAVAAGADGLLVEVHDQPEAALSDGDQALTPPQFVELMQQVSAVARSVGRRVAPPARARQAASVVEIPPPGEASA